MSIFVLYLLVCEVKVLDDCPVKLYLKIIKKVYSWFLTVSLWPFFTHQVSKNPSYFSAKSTWKWIYFTAQQKKQMTCPSTARWCSNQIRILSFSRFQIALNKNIQQEPCFGMVGFRGELPPAETSAIFFPRQHPASSVRPQHAALPGQCLKKCISWKCLESSSSWWLNQPIWNIWSSNWVHLPQFSGWK